MWISCTYVYMYALSLEPLSQLPQSRPSRSSESPELSSLWHVAASRSLSVSPVALCACQCCCCVVLSRVWLFSTPWTAACPGSSVHGISQARILEWVAISYSRGSSWPRDEIHVSDITGIGKWIFFFFSPLRHLGSPFNINVTLSIHPTLFSPPSLPTGSKSLFSVRMFFFSFLKFTFGRAGFSLLCEGFL